MFDWFGLVILPLVIFFARIVDVGLGTIKVIFITRGYKSLATIIAFFEITAWLIAARQVFANLNTPIYAVAYAAGFACGTYVGLFIAEKVSIGKVIIRVITRHDAKVLISQLQQQDYRVTWMDAHDPNGPVQIIFLIANSDEVPGVTTIIKKFNPHAFYSIEDVRRVSSGHFHTHRIFSFFSHWRKGK